MIVFAGAVPGLQAALLRASPDAAVMAGTLGIFLIFLELNRPGRILPGAFGLLLVLLAASALGGHGVELWPALLLLASTLVLLLNLVWRLPLWLLTVAVAGLCFGMRLLLRPGLDAQVHIPVAVCCGLVLGASGAFLSRVAVRARRAKRVN